MSLAKLKYRLEQIKSGNGFGKSVIEAHRIIRNRFDLDKKTIKRLLQELRKSGVEGVINRIEVME